MIRARRFLLAVPAALVALSVVLPSAATAGKAAVHEPPYKPGPTGGDEFNHVTTDPEAGTVEILRLFPGIPPVVGCAPEPSAGWGMLRLKHDVDRPVKTVTVNYDGMLDPYAWVTAGVRDAKGGWLGVAKYQGPHQGAGALKVKLHDRPRIGSKITVEFGLQLGDACPQVGGARASFPSVKVK